MASTKTLHYIMNSDTFNDVEKFVLPTYISRGKCIKVSCVWGCGVFLDEEFTITVQVARFHLCV